VTFQPDIGDVVSLKSGGHAMTVEHVDGDSVSCVWPSRDGRMRRDSFQMACLRHGDSQFDGLADPIFAGVTHSDEAADQYLIDGDCAKLNAAKLAAETDESHETSLKKATSWA
jgi:uncharacterized protein YodC (DUF2158 family)